MEKKTNTTVSDELVLTNKDVYMIRNGFASIKPLTGFILVREANRNLHLCENYIKALQATIEESDAYKQGYGKELGDLRIALGDKDDKGALILDRTGSPIVNINILEYTEKVEALQKKHKVEFDKQEAKVKEFNENLDKPADIVLYKFSESQIPANVTVEQGGILMFMVDYTKGMVKEEDTTNSKPNKKK
jgi:hypothetical protein